ANTKMAEAGVGGHEGKVWLANFAAHLLVATAGYFLFGGARLKSAEAVAAVGDAGREAGALSGRQRFTAGMILAWIVGVVVFKLNLGLSAFAAVTLLLVFRAAEETVAFKRVPWSVIIMVSGVTVLIALLEV